MWSLSNIDQKRQEKGGGRKTAAQPRFRDCDTESITRSESYLDPVDFAIHSMPIGGRLENFDIEMGTHRNEDILRLRHMHRYYSLI